MQRLTRADAQLRTRKLIVESATDLFLRDGFDATSLEEVAAHAGFTRGAVYSNFSSKVALGSAVIDELYEREIDRVLELAESASDEGLSAVVASIDTWAQSVVGDRAWFRLEMAVVGASANDGYLLTSTSARYGRIREATTTLLHRLELTHGLDLPIDSETLASGLFSLILGLGMLRAADPSVSTDVAASLIGILLGAKPQP